MQKGLGDGDDIHGKGSVLRTNKRYLTFPVTQSLLFWHRNDGYDEVTMLAITGHVAASGMCSGI